jgi:hypothetical protein
MQQNYPQHLSVSVKNFWLQTGEISDVGCRWRWAPMVRILKILFSACLSHKSNYSEIFSAWIFSPQLRNFMPIKLKSLIRKTRRIYRHRRIWQWANELKLHAIWKNAEHEGAEKAHIYHSVVRTGRGQMPSNNGYHSKLLERFLLIHSAYCRFSYSVLTRLF